MIKYYAFFKRYLQVAWMLTKALFVDAIISFWRYELER